MVKVSGRTKKPGNIRGLHNFEQTREEERMSSNTRRAKSMVRRLPLHHRTVWRLLADRVPDPN